MDEIARGKYDFNVVGHYARRDVFRLHVDERPAPAAVHLTPVPAAGGEPEDGRGASEASAARPDTEPRGPTARLVKNRLPRPRSPRASTRVRR